MEDCQPKKTSQHREKVCYILEVLQTKLSFSSKLLTETLIMIRKYLINRVSFSYFKMDVLKVGSAKII